MVCTRCGLHQDLSPAKIRWRTVTMPWPDPFKPGQEVLKTFTLCTPCYHDLWWLMKGVPQKCIQVRPGVEEEMFQPIGWKKEGYDPDRRRPGT